MGHQDYIEFPFNIHKRELLIDLHYKLPMTNETVQLGPKLMLGCPDCRHPWRQAVVFLAGCDTGRCRQCAEGYLESC